MSENISTLSDTELDAVAAGTYQFNAACISQSAGGYFTFNAVNVSSVQQANNTYTVASGNNYASISVSVS